MAIVAYKARWEHIERVLKEAREPEQSEDSEQVAVNLSPMFSSDVSDFTTSTAANGEKYWYRNNLNASFEDKGDGWCRVFLDNSAGTKVARTDYVMAASDGIECGKDYTFLFEFRNNDSVAPTSGAVQVYQVQQGSPVSVQFWGNACKKLLEGTGANSCTVLANPGGTAHFAPGMEGVYAKRFVRTSEAEDSAYYARAGFKGLCCLVAYAGPGGVFDCEMRVSVYEGEYAGPYVPFLASRLEA